MGFIPHELQSAARQAGMSVKKCFDIESGEEIEGRYELRSGDYTQMVGTYEEIMATIAKRKPKQAE